MSTRAGTSGLRPTAPHLTDAKDPNAQALPWQPLMLPVSSLRPAERNPRTHSKTQIRKIGNAILTLGWINPIVVDRRGRIHAGVGRWLAAQSIGLKLVPVIQVGHLNEAQLRAYRLADNRLGQESGWDRALLAIELEELQVELPEIGLDLDVTGFDPGEVDAVLTDLGSEQRDPADDDVEPTNEPTVSRLGDVFVLGDHRLIVGDAQRPDVFEHLMEGALAEMGFFDPPYNEKISGLVGRGKTKHREFAFASGEMSSEQYVAFLRQTLGLCAAHSIDGSVHYVCVSWRRARDLLEAGAAVYDELKNICVWAKTNAGQGSFYRSQHELVFVYKNGPAQCLNNFGLGANGRSRSNLWRYAGVNTFRAGRMDELRMHPTVKPVALVADAILDCSRRGSIVLDAFAGSGTSILAAEKVGRRAYCIEIDPAYADVAIRRWQRFTGRDAILEATGQTFGEVRGTRVGPSADPTSASSKSLRSAKERR